jgi:hypothetical protein
MKFFSTAYVLRLVGLAVVIGGLLGVAGASSTAAASPQFGPVIEFWDGSSWTPQASPNPGGSAELSAVTAISATDVWAVGAYGRLILPFGGGSALAEHWDGSSWQQVAMPTPSGADEVHLYGAAATSASDVWAVGSWAGPGGRKYAGEGQYATLIEHWDGTSWTILPSPPPRGTAQLYGVTAVSPTNAWAVGYYGKHVGLNRTFVLHWNGVTWNQVPSPHPGYQSTSQLSGVAAVSPRSVWAVGSYLHRGDKGQRSNQTLTLHWNGKSWKQVSSPTWRSSGEFSAVEAVGRNNVWAVGGYHNGHGPQPLAEHWNGHSWRLVAVRLGTGAQGLTSLAAVTGNDIWAAGTYDIGNDQTLTEHWDGSAWSLVSSPNPATDESNHLWAIAAATPTAAWAVGCFYLGD